MKLTPKEFKLISEEINSFRKNFRAGFKSEMSSHEHFTTVKINSEKAAKGLIAATVYKTLIEVLNDMESDYKKLVFKS